MRKLSESSETDSLSDEYLDEVPEDVDSSILIKYPSDTDRMRNPTVVKRVDYSISDSSEFGSDSEPPVLVALKSQEESKRSVFAEDNKEFTFGATLSPQIKRTGTIVVDGPKFQTK